MGSKNETAILNSIENKYNVNIIRQYPICGFIVDGYDDINNVVYEVDEGYHRTTSTQLEKDIKREEIITTYLKCGFIRIIDNTH